MKAIILKTKEFLAACKFCLRACKTTTPLPAYNHLRIRSDSDFVDFIEVRATNGNAFLSRWCPSGRGDDFDVGVPASKLCDFLGTLSEDLCHLRIENGKLAVKSGEPTARFATIPTAEFPPWLVVEEALFLFSPTEKWLRSMLGKVRYAQGNESRGAAYNATRMLFTKDGVEFCATIGPLIAQATNDAFKGDKEAIVPAFLSGLIYSALSPTEDTEVAVRLSDAAIEVCGANWAISGPLVNASYPPVVRIFKNTKWLHRIKTPRKELMASINRVRMFTSSVFSPIALDFSKSGLKLSNVGGEHACEDLIVMQCPALKVLVNPDHLYGTLEVMEGDEVEIGLSDSLTPMLLQEEGFQGVFSLCVSPTTN